MKIVDWNMSAPCGAQGDVIFVRLREEEAAGLKRTYLVKSNDKGELKLLEGEMTGHFHMVEPMMFRDDAFARSLEQTTKRGRADLYEDKGLIEELEWLWRDDLAIGFLEVKDGPVVISHPEHDGIRLPEGIYYVGRQVEQAGAEERIVVD